MLRKQVLYRACAIATAVVAAFGGGCRESSPSAATVRNVERELKNIVAPPGAYVSASIGQRFVKLSQPAMRIKRAVLNERGELAITFVALRDGEEKTDTVPLSEGEATHLRKLKSVPFVLGGEKAQTEFVPLTTGEAKP